MRNSTRRIGWLSILLAGSALVAAQAPPPAPPAQAGQVPAAPGARGGMRGGPQVVSPQMEPDGRVTFRMLAPNATAVTVGGDINGSMVPDPAAKPAPAVTMTKGETRR